MGRGLVTDDLIEKNPDHIGVPQSASISFDHVAGLLERQRGSEGSRRRQCIVGVAQRHDLGARGDLVARSPVG